MDKPCHLSDPTSTTDSLDESSTMDAPDDYLLELDSTSLTFQLQNTSSVEIEFVPRVEVGKCRQNVVKTMMLHPLLDYLDLGAGSFRMFKVMWLKHSVVQSLVA